MRDYATCLNVSFNQLIELFGITDSPVKLTFEIGNRFIKDGVQWSMG